MRDKTLFASGRIGECLCFVLFFGVILPLLIAYSPRLYHYNEDNRVVPKSLSIQQKTIKTQSTSRSLTASILSNVYISVKTTPKCYNSRLSILKETWFQKVDKEKLTIVSDYSYVKDSTVEDELAREGFHIVRAKCTTGHYPVQWFCHFDDDIYVNIKQLSNLLSKYDSTKPYYIGRYPRSIGVQVTPHIFRRLKDNYNISGVRFWYSAGATYCISLALMMKLEKYFDGIERFQHTCGITEYTDDKSVGAIINLVMGYNVTHIDAMYNQATDLGHLSTEDLMKMVTFSYSSGNGEGTIDPQPRLFTNAEDPSR